MFEKVKNTVARFVDRHLDGHLTLGPLTLDGANALDWRATLRVPALGVTLSLKAPTRKRGWCFYASPNSTPWAAVLGCGPGLGRENRDRIAQRLDVISESPRPSDEAEKLWDLWAIPKPASSGTVPGGGGGTFEGPFNAEHVPLRRFTYDPSDPSGVASA